MNRKLYDVYVEVLNEELLPAMGCTEPIAVAYGGALARKALGKLPEEITLVVSGNIIKNVKSVIVPNTDGRKGLQVAVAAGICYGKEDRELELLEEATPEDLRTLDEFLERVPVKLEKSTLETPFDIQVTLKAGEDEAFSHIIGHHTNVVTLRKNQDYLVDEEFEACLDHAAGNRAILSVEGILEFAWEADLEDVRHLLDRQISYNMAIAEEGLTGKYGARIGDILLKAYGESVHNRAKAWAAAGSDARMNGCELPVIINSGSGNQGITVSVPVIVYARELGVSQDTLYRALIVSNLVAIHLKTGIGRLSAYCGATSAGVGAGAGICYLYGGGYDEIVHTVVNALAINSGMLCDGAKSSCAAKIASAVEAGLLGMQMNQHDSQFYGGDGIVIHGVENTIRAVAKIAREGMKETDNVILDVMIE